MDINKNQQQQSYAELRIQALGSHLHLSPLKHVETLIYEWNLLEHPISRARHVPNMSEPAEPEKTLPNVPEALLVPPSNQKRSDSKTRYYTGWRCKPQTGYQLTQQLDNVYLIC